MCFSVLAGTTPVAMLAAQPSETAQEVVTSTVQASKYSDHEIEVYTSNGGLVQVNPSNASEGEHVRITVNPNYGYKLDSLTVTRSSTVKVTLKQENTNLYSFTMPNKDVTITVSLKNKSIFDLASPGSNKNYPDKLEDFTPTEFKEDTFKEASKEA